MNLLFIPVIIIVMLCSGCAPLNKATIKVSCNTKNGPIGDLNLTTSNAIIVKGGSVLFVNDRGQLVEVKEAACGVTK